MNVKKYTEYSKNQAKQMVTSIESIIETMKETAQIEVNMETWVYNENENIHNLHKTFECGYAACVIGDHIIRTQRIDLPITDTTADLVSSYSNILVNMLKRLSYNSTGTIDFALSIYAEDPEVRYDGALHSGLFTRQEVDSYSHLIDSNPKPSDVVIYLEAINNKLLNVVINQQ